MDAPLLCKVDAVTVPVPDLDSGLAFYMGQLRHRLAWRNDDIGQAAVALRDSDTEIVLTTRDRYEPNWLVEDVEEAAAMFEAAGDACSRQPSISRLVGLPSSPTRLTTCSCWWISRRAATGRRTTARSPESSTKDRDFLALGRQQTDSARCAWPLASPDEDVAE